MGTAEDLNLLERNIDTLKHDYEQYFVGVNKTPPTTLRTAAERLIRKYSGMGINNAGLRFRYHNLVARFNTLSELWTRRLRMREEGIVIGAPQRTAPPVGGDSRPRPLPPPDEPARTPAAAGGGANPPAAAKQARPAAGASGPEKDRVFSATTRDPLREADVVKQLFDEYVKAQERAGGAAKKVSREGFQNLIAKQVGTIKQSYNCDAVNFRIQVENGEVKLKAKPVK